MIKKILLILLISLGVVLLNTDFALAAKLFGSINMDSGEFDGFIDPSEMLQNMGVNSTAMKDMIESMNVATNKKEVPTSSITFSPDNPKDGEDVNANTMIQGFKNSKESLYFTWFIKHDAKCPEDDNPGDYSLCGYKSTASEPYSDNDARRCVKGNCDWDEDDDVTLNDYKIEAIRLLAADKFDSDFPDESYYDDGYDVDSDNSDDDGYTAIHGGEKSQQSDSEDAKDTVKMCYIHDYKSGNDYQIVSDDDIGGFLDPDNPIPLDPDDPIPSNCFHLFPKDRGGDIVSEDGLFKVRQERLFGTDHHRADTLGLGEKDGASVVGLGLDKIAWEYKQGDKAGVVVEGTSNIPNKYHNTSMQIMWTFPEIEDCKIDSLTSETAPPPDTPLPQIDLSALGLDKLMLNVATINEEGIDECLLKSMKDVMAAGPELLDVTLTPTPDSPMMEDTIRVTSSVSNSSNDAAQMKYAWTFSGKKEDGTDFTEADVTAVGPLTGNGLSSISFRIKPTSKPDGNITVKVTISENYDSSGVIQRGKGSVAISINSSGDRIEVYQVNIVGTGSDNVTLSLGSKICNQGKELSVCPVLQNQIVAVKTENASGVSNFLWTLNGKPLNCNSAMSPDDCKDVDVLSKVPVQNNVNFFPIAGSAGQKYSLLLTANNVGASGSDLNLTRNFQVVNPSVKIVTDGTSAWPKYLGEYTPLDSKDCVDFEDSTNDLCADYSQSVFETGSGNSVTLSTKFSPDWLKDDPTLETEWTIDGQVSTNSSFTAGALGDVNIIQINAIYTPSEDTRWALEKFGISGYNSTEQSFSKLVQVEVVEANNPTAMSNSKKLVASLLSNLPEQIFFLLRIMLSIFVIILVSNIVFIFSPSREIEDNN